MEGGDFGDGEDVVCAWLRGGGGGGCGCVCVCVDGDEVGDWAGGEECPLQGVVGGEDGSKANAVGHGGYQSELSNTSFRSTAPNNNC